MALASAPGKVILFGEHAVVYGVTAVSAALSDLRIFVSVHSLGEASERLDVYLYDLKGPGEERPAPLSVPYETLRRLLPRRDGCSSLMAENPKEEELAPMRDEFSHISPQASQGVMAICYLVSRLLPELVESGVGLKIDVKSIGLPIGAGLGSSAAFSVALAASLMQMRQRLFADLSSAADIGDAGQAYCAALDVAKQEGSSLPTVFDLERINQSGVPGWVPPATLLPVLNAWAYAAEVVIHGAPSGLDNTTSCFGGALKYDKNAGKFDTLAKLPDIQILLTNTKVPRSTKQLVAGVRTLYDKLPSVLKPIFDAVEGISQRFLEIIGRDSAVGNQEQLVEEIGTLFRINQDLLNAMGVGHSSLNSVCEASKSQGFACKLTGAGGGGCAITLLNSSSLEPSGGDNGRVILQKKLADLGFETFQSALAGDGVKWHLST